MKKSGNVVKSQKARRQQQQKKQLLFLIAVAAIIVAAAAGLIAKAVLEGKSDNKVSSDVFAETEDEDVIVFDGKKYVYNDHLSNFLFMGIDSSKKTDEQKTQSDAGQADSIFLLAYDRKENTLQSLAIPRDTMTEIESFSFSGNSQGMQTNHLNLQYAYGDGKWKSCELMKTAVSHLLYGVPIQGYCSVKMDAVPILVDIAGGVDVTVSDDSLQDKYPEFTMGSTVTLTSENALAYVRYRDTDQENSALVRQQRHRSFLDGFLAKVQEMSAQDAGIVTDLYEGIQDYMVTNMGNDQFVKLLDASKHAPVVSETVPGEGAAGAYHDEYHVDEEELYKLIIRMFYEEVN